MLTSKIQLMLHSVLLPIKDMQFFENNKLNELIEAKMKMLQNTNDFKDKLKNDKKFKDASNQLVLQVRNKFMQQMSLRNTDEIELLLSKYYYGSSKIHQVQGSLNLMQSNQDSDKWFLHSAYDVYDANLGALVRCLFSHRDGAIVFKYWKNSNDELFLGLSDESKKVLIYQYLSRLTTQDYLVCHYLTQNEIFDIQQLNGYFGQINLADMQLDDVLIKGVSENHMHLSAGFNFNLVWQELMFKPLEAHIYKEFKANGLADLGFSKDVEAYILYATNIRIILSAYLKDIETPESDLYSENSFCHDYSFYKWADEDGFLTVKTNESDKNRMRTADNEKVQLVNTVLKLNRTTIENEAINHRIQQEQLKILFDIDMDKVSVDWIYSFFPETQGIETYGECIFLFKSCVFMKWYLSIGRHKDEGGSFEFFKLFYRYINIKNEFYQQSVQGDALKGLNFFQEYFGRGTSIPKKTLGNEYYKLLFKTHFYTDYLKKIEVRLAPSANVEYMKVQLRDILVSYKSVIDQTESKFTELRELQAETRQVPKGFPRLGLIYHFIKSVDNNYGKCWIAIESDENADEDSQDSYKLVFKRKQNEYLNELKQLMNLRKESPYLSYFILGIDAASLENNTPVDVFATVYDLARDSNSDLLNQTDRDGNRIKVKSLAFTFHAGEDFRHIISGLRRMDEVIQYCKFHSGDRIGHGTALGIDVEDWIVSNEVVILPRMEYLDNLLWIWGVFSNPKHLNPKYIVYLEKTIYGVAKEIYLIMKGITVQMLYEAYCNRFNSIKVNRERYGANNEKTYGVNLHDQKNQFAISCVERKIEESFFCIRADENHRDMWTVEKIMNVRHCECYLEKMQEPIYVTTTDLDTELISDMQRYLKAKISKQGIVVEMNPSSNAIIGEMKSIFEHHALSINQVDSYKNENVLISINSDDPLTFNTNIINEYAYLYYGLISRGYSKELVLKWIDKNRRVGMETSFIKDTISDEEYYLYLEKSIQSLS